MKILLIIFFLFSSTSDIVWENDLDTAFQKSKGQEKAILLNFSGSDWCVPCQKLKKGLFLSDQFVTYASENLILVNLDFPMKHTGEDKDYIAKKDLWSEKYNPNGSFPLTILIDKHGNVVKKWTGNITLPVDKFLEQINIAK